jgi:hypothetical protein
LHATRCHVIKDCLSRAFSVGALNMLQRINKRGALTHGGRSDKDRFSEMERRSCLIEDEP